MENKATLLTAQLRGIRPIMFDPYGGTNETALKPEEKFYTDAKGRLGIPILNVYSLLTAQNTPSVAKRFYGKKARDLALGIQAFVNIFADNPDDDTFAPLEDAEGKQWMRGDSRICYRKDVARLKDGIPNPKHRPFLPTGWRVRIKFEHVENDKIQIQGLQQMVAQGGIIGLGTFRPIFGRYAVDWI